MRVKDVCFDEGHIVVRNGKGDKDRITVLPECCVDDLKRQIEAVRRLHEQDLQDGFGKVYLPHALARKYPNANREFCWQWVFPSRQFSKDPRSGQTWRHHVSESAFGDRFKAAVRKVGIMKNAVPHSLRQFRHASFADRHKHQEGARIAGTQGYSTTMVYLHVMEGGLTDVRSPLDALVDEKA